jgi:hypothetical protein
MQLSQASMASETMRPVAISAISVLAMWLGGTPSTAAHGHDKASRKCAPGHSRVLAADTQAEVYEARGPSASQLEVYGCAVGQRRAHVLGVSPFATQPGGRGVNDETLTGPLVAYQSSSLPATETSGRSEWVVVVRDLRTGRVLHNVPTGTPKLPSASVGIGTVLAIVLKRDAAVAWIAETDAARPSEFQVHVVDRSGSRLLAAGHDVNPPFLELAGGTLYWFQDTRLHSAPMR